MCSLAIGYLNGGAEYRSAFIISPFCENVKLKAAKDRTPIVLANRAFEASRTDRQDQIEGTVDLWIADFGRAKDSLTDYGRLLSEDEVERASQFKFDHLRDFYTFCRGTLRRTLSRYLAVPGDSIRFQYGEKGKPFLPQTRLQFNVSHSGSLFVCSVSSGLTIGVDVEQIRPIEDMTAIAAQFFAPAEQSHLASIAEEDRTHAFHECWTRKEAVIKATGEGVSRPLDSFEVAFGPGTMPHLMRIDDNYSPTWQMDSFEPSPGYVGAVTSPSPWSSIRIYYANDE
jgi:4'-phosphopantetheinyl transferase